MQITAAKMLDKQIIQLTALSCFLVVVRTWLIKRQNYWPAFADY
jgi:hypothetical protein